MYVLLFGNCVFVFVLYVVVQNGLFDNVVLIVFVLELCVGGVVFGVLQVNVLVLEGVVKVLLYYFIDGLLQGWQVMLQDIVVLLNGFVLLEVFGLFGDDVLCVLLVVYCDVLVLCVLGVDVLCYFIDDVQVVELYGQLYCGVYLLFDVNVICCDFLILQECVNGKQFVWFDNVVMMYKL